MILSRRRFLMSAASAPLALPVSACMSADGAPPPPTLRERADRAGLLFGTAIGPSVDTDAAYRAAVIRDCNALVCEYEMKWDHIAPTPRGRAFEAADRRLAFAKRHAMEMRGHTLVWHGATPRWLGQEATRATARRILEAHISETVGRYRGRIHSWDVVNEAIHPEDGESRGLRRTPLLGLIGPDYIETAFRAAAEADPGARLVYNDYGLSAPWGEARRRAALDLLERLLARGVPIHGVGIQCHLDLKPGSFDPETVHRFGHAVAAMGLDLLVTELDVADQHGPADEAERDTQVATIYGAFLDAVLATPRLVGILTWGLSDRHTWLARERPRSDRLPVRPLLYDRRMRPKAAWFAVAAALDRAGRKGV